MPYQFVEYEKRDRIAYITFNRPEVLNAMHAPMHVELAEIWQDFKDDDDRWVAIVTGAGDRAFSAGNDLKATAAQNAGGGRADQGGRRPSFAAITSEFECWKPMIAAVNGFAMGGGFETALACDIIIAAEHAQFGLPEPRVGLVAGAGGIHRLVRKAPFNVAMGMILTGKRISAQEAYRIGVVNEVVPLTELMTAAERWANDIMECAPLCVRLSKEAVYTGITKTVDEALASDRVHISPRLMASEDSKEGPRAFAEKRPPRWTGR
jgi:enoyl-CoA hydratase/carnithine racemase